MCITKKNYLRICVARQKRKGACDTAIAHYIEGVDEKSQYLVKN